MNFEKCSAHHQITVCLSTMNLSEPTYASYVCIKFMGYSAGYSFVVPGYIRWFFVRPWESLNCYGWPKWVHQWLGGSWLKLDKKTSGSPGRGFVKHCPPWREKCRWSRSLGVVSAVQPSGAAKWPWRSAINGTHKLLDCFLWGNHLYMYASTRVASPGTGVYQLVHDVPTWELLISSNFYILP